MKNEERIKQIKEHSIELKNYINSCTCIYSDIKYPVDIIRPSEISKIDSENMFSKLYDSFCEKQYKKAVTELKKSMESLGRLAFIAQMEYIKSNKLAKHKLLGFNRLEAIKIFEECLV